MLSGATEVVLSELQGIAVLRYIALNFLGYAFGYIGLNL
jgi:hypothetical protein